MDTEMNARQLIKLLIGKWLKREGQLTNQVQFLYGNKFLIVDKKDPIEVQQLMPASKGIDVFIRLKDGKQ